MWPWRSFVPTIEITTLPLVTGAVAGVAVALPHDARRIRENESQRMEGETRVVTFGNGAIAREPIVSIDDERRRLVWASVGGRATHYNAVMEVTADGTGCRVRWTIDLLPHELAPAISGMQRQGLATLKKTLESA
jgi:hypothetical protein